MIWISYEEALDQMRAALPSPGSGEIVALEEAAGRVCRGSIAAREDYPHFDNSAVDGYAVGWPEDAVAGARLTLDVRIAAGSPPHGALRRGAAARVLTGSVVPEDAFAVVMQEEVCVESDAIVLGEVAVEGQHIRRAGDDFFTGSPLLATGDRLGAGAIALLASQGLVQVEVYERPTVAVLTTGDELVPHGQEPRPGCLRDSNGPMLAVLARSAGADRAFVAHVPDDREATREAIVSLSESHDVLLCAGGASVGDRDHIPSLVAELGDIVFHGVGIRPGKPVLMGRIGPCTVFGLPGNPGSAFVTFELFSREAIARLGGAAKPEPLWVEAALDGDAKATNRDDFLRCSWVGETERPTVRPAGIQGSFGIRSLAHAQCLARIPAGRACRPGSIVSVLPLP